VTRDHIVERLYREIRALRICEGASEVQELIISARAIEQSRRTELSRERNDDS
jgi:acyl-CoA dehydrogenase